MVANTTKPMAEHLRNRCRSAGASFKESRMALHSTAADQCRSEPGGTIRPANSTPPPPCISYANVHNYYGPYAYCSLDKGVACAQHIQLLTHTYAGHICCNWQFRTYGMHQTSKKNSWCTSTGPHVLRLANVTTNPCLMWLQYISYIIKLRTKLLRSLRLLQLGLQLGQGLASTRGGGVRHRQTSCGDNASHRCAAFAGLGHHTSGRPTAAARGRCQSYGGGGGGEGGVAADISEWRTARG